MPEMTFTVRWPDGRVQACYSPSLVVHEHLSTGATYPVQDFVARATAALELASARVRDRYGFECTSAAAQKSAIEFTAGAFGPDAGSVEVLAMDLLAREPAPPPR